MRKKFTNQEKKEAWNRGGSLRPRTLLLEEKIKEHAARTVDKSDASNHPFIEGWHRRVLKDYEKWREKNGKGSNS